MKRKIKRASVIERQQKEILEMQKKLDLQMEILYGQGELIHDLLTEIKQRLEN